MDQLVFRSATQLAQAILSRELSSLEVVSAYIDQISRYNSQVNAVVTLDRERALDRARLADAALAKGEIWGPLHGVPVTIKDVFATAGIRTTSGSRRLAAYVPKQDAPVVARLRAAGAIILGKTNTPEFAGDDQTNNTLFGRTNNPWNLERTPGGSSGGSAAAIAAGFSALEIGSDIGGSVRNPAAFCGIFSLKPSDSLVPFTGHIPPPPGVTGRGLLRHFLSPGPLARSVEDLRLALQIIAGPLDEMWEIPPVELKAPVSKPLAALKIAWSNDLGLPLSAEVCEALAALAGRLARAGCRVERCNPPDFDFNRALQTYGYLKQAALTALGTPLHLPRFILRMLSGCIPASNPITRGSIRGSGAGLSEYALALSRRDAYITSMEKFLQDWDAFICPVAACTAFAHIPTGNVFEQLTARVKLGDGSVPYFMATAAYVTPFNLTGSPVVVLPVGRTGDGLPLGIQLVGRRWHDMDLLNVAQTLTGVTGAFEAPPGY